MDVVEPPWDWSEGLQRCSDVCLDLRPLTTQACLRPMSHLLVQSVPNEFGGHKAFCGLGSRVR